MSVYLLRRHAHPQLTDTPAPLSKRPSSISPTSLDASIRFSPAWCRLGGLVVRRLPPERETRGSKPTLPGSTHTNGLKIGALAADRLVGLVVRRPPPERKIPGSNPACTGIFSGSSHTSDLKIGTPEATLPGASRYRVSAGTGRPGVSIL